MGWNEWGLVDVGRSCGHVIERSMSWVFRYMMRAEEDTAVVNRGGSCLHRHKRPPFPTRAQNNASIAYSKVYMF